MSRPLSLLIVEDSKDDAGLLLRALFAGGFDVTYEVVDNAVAMHTAIKSKQWDVIASDHSMPRFSGPAALALARELCPNVPFIIISGDIDLRVAVSLMRGGAKDYLQKSELDMLVPLVERVLHETKIRSKQQAAEQALLQVSESRYRRLFETAQDGILIVNADTGQIDDVNPFLTNMLGYSHAEYMQKKLWEIGLYKDDEVSKIAFLELESKGYVRHEHIPLRTKAGGSVDVEFVSNIYFVDQKRVIQCNIREIGERKQAEAEILRLTADLEKRVEARTAQVEALNKELGTFNHSVSHDLRAPLRRIKGLVTALEEDCAERMDTRGKQLIQDVRASTEHMTGLIESLLKLASLSKGDLRRKPTNLSAIAHTIAAELQQSDPGREVKFVITEDLAPAGDPALLRIVMENLLANAWKFTSLGGLARIEFGVVHHAQKGTTYFVRDNGVGFDMKYADKLFGAFQRLHAQNEFPGTGIGLASVQRIIHRHGGHIWAESAIDQGATFYFALEAEPKAVFKDLASTHPTS